VSDGLEAIDLSPMVIGGETLEARSGETLDVGAGYHAYLQRMPLGVCGVIVPFNHPFLIMARGVAPALATGNTVVVKPSELTPLTALRFARLVEEAGLPPGVVNVVTGLGTHAGVRLVEHPEVKKVDFTGGVETGRQVAVAAARRFAGFSTELGGKAPVIVFDDAGLERATRGAAFAGFIAAGQTCVCGSRLLVQEAIYDEFIEKLAGQARSIRVGDPADPTTQMGPLISAAARDRSARYAVIARTEGATVITGGSAPALEHPLNSGFFFSPTLVSEATNSMTCAQEEIFGPLLTAVRFRDEDDAIRQRTTSASASALRCGPRTSPARTASPKHSSAGWCGSTTITAPRRPCHGAGSRTRASASSLARRRLTPSPRRRRSPSGRHQEMSTGTATTATLA
jgi:acyl-CoA reductase-like NAD-dependent aldehyde dehydrogenase